jgi:hypothetical protein
MHQLSIVTIHRHHTSHPRLPHVSHEPRLELLQFLLSDLHMLGRGLFVDLHLVSGDVVELVEVFADHEFAEAVGVVTDHEEQLQAALGRLADAVAGEVLEKTGLNGVYNVSH